jgi:hypothetical protein
MAENEKKHTPESIAAKVAKALLKCEPKKQKPRKRRRPTPNHGGGRLGG